MVKADDVVIFDAKHPEDFTEFEYLQSKVEQMEKVLNVHADILRENNLIVTEKTVAPYTDENEVFLALSGK